MDLNTCPLKNVGEDAIYNLCAKIVELNKEIKDLKDGKADLVRELKQQVSITRHLAESNPLEIVSVKMYCRDRLAMHFRTDTYHAMPFVPGDRIHIVKHYQGGVW